MERFDRPNGERGEFPLVDAFIDDIVATCRKHGLSIGHEDGHGAFIIEPFSESNADWLNHAHIDLRPSE